MILFMVLAIIAFILLALAIVVLVTGGTIGFVLFGDLIVCVAITILIIKMLVKKKH